MDSNILEYIRYKNKIRSSKCHYCDKPSMDIIAQGYTLHYVCQTHSILYGQYVLESFEE